MELSDRCCSLHNIALANRRDAWINQRKTIKYIDQQNKLPNFKKRNPEYKVVYSKVLQGILKKLDADYNRSQMKETLEGSLSLEREAGREG